MEKSVSVSTSRDAPANRCVSRTFSIGLFLVAVFLYGCAGQSYHRSESALPQLDHPPIVLLMKPDIELSELTAGGVLQPHARWTEAGVGNVEQALADVMRRRQAAMIPYESPADPDQAYQHNQIIKLHRVVGSSILIHKYSAVLALPTKEEVFDWSLGPEVQELGRDYNADYALFVFLRDSYSTAGRQALIVTMALLRGAVIRGGMQAGFASLVNLRTGEVVWFNRLLRDTGDLRNPEPAKEAVDTLLVGFPL